MPPQYRAAGRLIVDILILVWSTPHPGTEECVMPRLAVPGKGVLDRIISELAFMRFGVQGPVTWQPCMQCYGPFLDLALSVLPGRDSGAEAAGLSGWGKFHF